MNTDKETQALVEDGQTLRGYIATHGETPSMTQSRVQALTAELETARRERDEARTTSEERLKCIDLLLLKCREKDNANHALRSRLSTVEQERGSVREDLAEANEGWARQTADMGATIQARTEERDEALAKLSTVEAQCERLRGVLTEAHPNIVWKKALAHAHNFENTIKWHDAIVTKVDAALAPTEGKLTIGADGRCECCNGEGVTGGLTREGYEQELCPECKGTGRQPAHQNGGEA